MAHNCPHLQKVTLHKATEEGVLTLAAHCRQLREVSIYKTTLTEETIRQLAQNCRHLTKLLTQISVLHKQPQAVNVREAEVYKHFSRKDLRAMI